MDLKEVVRKRMSSSTEEKMKQHFETRTNMHIGLVNKYLGKIAALNLPEIDNNKLVFDSHDASKFKEPEYTPYLHVNWKYRMKDLGEEYTPSREILDSMAEATFHHVKNNMHHPEFWDGSWTLDKDAHKPDRDSPALEMVDATKMPLTHVAQMVADWLAMSEEKKTFTKDWADRNVNVRWRFNQEQVDLIYRIIEIFGENS